MTHNNQKKIAVISDMSGFGRCSMTVSLPIISHMKVQCCPVPTSIFSNHSGFPEYYMDDYTEHIEPYVAMWKKLNLEFEGIYTGFLGSMQQIAIVRKFIQDFRTTRTTVIVDPVMGDDGSIYSSCTDSMCQQMKELVRMADIITPNITEACHLTGRSYKAQGWKLEQLHTIAQELSELGPKKVIITGIKTDKSVANYIYDSEPGETQLIRSRIVGTTRCGTGDIFSSIISADAVNGVPLTKSVRKASAFVRKCIAASVAMEIPESDGVCFEEVLGQLKV